MSDDTKQNPSDRDVAIALSYDEASDEAPRVVAKGYGEVARRIIAAAEENDVMIEANPHLAEALGGMELDDTIPIELYQAVAEVIGFVLRARDKMQ